MGICKYHCAGKDCKEMKNINGSEICTVSVCPAFSLLSGKKAIVKKAIVKKNPIEKISADVHLLETSCFRFYRNCNFTLWLETKNILTNMYRIQKEMIFESQGN